MNTCILFQSIFKSNISFSIETIHGATFFCIMQNIINHFGVKRFLHLDFTWSWSYSSWIYNYLCSQCLSPPVVS